MLLNLKIDFRNMSLLKGSSSRLHWSLKDPNFEGWWTWGCGGSLKMSAQYLRSFHYAYAEETDQLT